MFNQVFVTCVALIDFLNLEIFYCTSGFGSLIVDIHLINFTFNNQSARYSIILI